MRNHRLIRFAALLGMLAASAAFAQDSRWVPLRPATQLAAQQPPPPEPPPDLFGQAQGQGPSGSSSSGSGHSQMVGDLPGGSYVPRIVTRSASILVQLTELENSSSLGGPLQVVNVALPGVVKQVVNVPLATRGAFKIAENESPFPQCRAYLSYNYFDNVRAPQAGPTTLAQLDTSALHAEEFANFDIEHFEVLGIESIRALKRLDLHRETFGVESTCLGDDFSLGLRLPILQQRGEPTLDSSRVGDLTAIAKYAFLNDRETGDVLSAGLAVTVPTGDDEIDAFGDENQGSLVQPFLGAFVNFGRAYLHGFSSVVIPTEQRETTLLCLDAGVGYRLYESEGSLLSYVSPTVEGHFTMPLTDRGDSRDEFAVRFPDIFVLTGATHFGLGECATLTLGVAVPMTGPQPFDAEAQVQLNLRF